MIISLIVNLLLAIVILRLVLKREKEIKIVYANTVAQDAEASDEHPPDPSPRVESPRAHRSSSAQLSSSSRGLSAEADEVTAPLGEAGSRDKNTTAQEPIGGTGNAAAAAATTNDDETGYVDIDDPAQTLVEMSTESYLNDWSLYEVEALALRLGYNKGWSVVSLDTAYLQTENSYQNRELYKTFKAVWHPEVKHWTLPPGRDLRRAYEGGWIVNGDMVYAESLRKWLLIARRAEIQDIVRRIIKDERRKMRLRRATKNHG